MVCEHCSHENAKHAKFCESCGKQLPQDGQKPQKKKSKKGPIIAVVAAIIVILLGSVFGAVKYLPGLFLTDQERLLRALVKTATADLKHQKTVLRIDEMNMNGNESMDAKMLQGILQGVEVEFESKEDREKGRLEGHLTLGLQSTQLFNLSYGLDQEGLVLSLPLLYDVPLFISWDDLMDRSLSDTGWIDRLGPYQEALGSLEDDDRLQTLVDHHSEPLMAYLEESVSLNEDDVYIIETDYNDFMRFYVSFLMTLFEDEAMDLFLEEVLLTLSETMVEEKDLETYNLLASAMEDTTYETWDQALIEREVRDLRRDLVEEYRMNKTDALYELDQEMDDLLQVTDDLDIRFEGQVTLDEAVETSRLSMTYNLDSILKQAEENGLYYGELADFGGSISLGLDTDIISLDQAIEFEDIKGSNSLDLGSLSDEELGLLMDEIQQNMMDLLGQSDMFDMIY